MFEINSKDRSIGRAVFSPKIETLKMNRKPSPAVLGFAKTDFGVEMLSGEMKSTGSIIKKPDCFYISALNATNVIRKLKNAGFGDDWEVLK